MFGGVLMDQLYINSEKKKVKEHGPNLFCLLHQHSFFNS